MCDPAWGPPEGIYGGREPARQAAVSSALLVGLARRTWQRNYGLFRRLLRAFDALGQCRGQLGDDVDGFASGAPVRIEAVLEGVDQRGADHGAIGMRGDGAGGLRCTDAKADADRQFCVPFVTGNCLADSRGVPGRSAGDTGET